MACATSKKLLLSENKMKKKNRRKSIAMAAAAPLMPQKRMNCNNKHVTALNFVSALGAKVAFPMSLTNFEFLVDTTL